MKCPWCDSKTAWKGDLPVDVGEEIWGCEVFARGNIVITRRAVHSRFDSETFKF
ncbi:MAG: hypothetical protein ACLUKN_04430 [Bacilli bacterium]